MAKARFQRNKPHVNVGSASKHLAHYQLESALTQFGVSAHGAREFTAGRPVTHLTDRRAIAEFTGKMVLKGKKILQN